MHKKYKIMLFLRHSVLNMFNKKNKMESNSNKQVDCLMYLLEMHLFLLCYLRVASVAAYLDRIKTI